MKSFIKIVLVFILIAICISCYVILPYCYNESWKVGLCILVGSIILAGVFIIILWQERFQVLRTQLLKEYKYLFHDATPAWVIGLLIASFISGLILLAFGGLGYNNSEINPSSFDIVSLYVGCILGVVAIRAFYMKLHPIYDELKLIREITIDLKGASKEDVVWFSFPGLNLCEYRIQTHQNKLGLSDFNEYKNALNEKINNGEYEFHGICFDKDNIDKLFDKYGEINKNGTASTLSDDAVKTCKETAKQFIDSIESAKTNNKKSSLYKMLPENPVEAFVIIGDIVYTIQAWGLPVFKNGNFEDPFKGSIANTKLVKLIAYRQHDGELAKTIIERTKTIVAA